MERKHFIVLPAFQSAKDESAYMDTRPHSMNSFRDYYFPFISALSSKFKTINSAFEICFFRGCTRCLKILTRHFYFFKIMIFPEGTCTNRSCLITFKPGMYFVQLSFKDFGYWNMKFSICYCLVSLPTLQQICPFLFPSFAGYLESIFVTLIHM